MLNNYRGEFDRGEGANVQTSNFINTFKKKSNKKFELLNPTFLKKEDITINHDPFKQMIKRRQTNMVSVSRTNSLKDET